MTELGDVFVPGRLPIVTYVPRDALKLEMRLRDYVDEGGKILSLSGSTKSGKTVLVLKVVDGAIEISGGDVDEAESFWHAVVDHFGGVRAYPSVTKTIERGELEGASVGGRATVKPPMIELGVDGSRTSEASETQTQTISRDRPINLVAKELLEQDRSVLFIDDFHYMKQDVQLAVVRGLKPLIFRGLRVIIASVPHRAFDAVRVEKEMTGRVEQLSIPLWREEELASIATRGFTELNVSASESDILRLAKEAFASPHLMQEFCLQWCKVENVLTTQTEPRQLKSPDWDAFFRERAPSASKSAFDLLVKGPPRTDRIARRLKNGTNTDIYGAILSAIAHTGPATNIPYDQLRASLREVLAEDPPQLHEVTRVLVAMSKIARDQIPGEAVVDYDEEYRTIHISDPFFAFFLRWGTDSGLPRKPL